MKITPFYEDQSGTWTYLLTVPESQAAAIIDPVWVYDLVGGFADFSFMDKVLDAVSIGCWKPMHTQII